VKDILRVCFFQIRETCRQPLYVVTTLLFPSMFFLFFGVPNATDERGALILISSFSCFAVLGVVLFQFGVSFAQDRASGWMLHLRTLPTSPHTLWIAKLLTGLFFAVLASLGVMLTAYVSVDFPFPPERLLTFYVSVWGGGLLFASLGIIIGLLCSPRAAVPASNLVYLPLSFAGGLWLPPDALPQMVQRISEWLPTRHYGEVVWAAALNEPLETRWWLGLVVYQVIFFVIAAILMKRDEGLRFG
jgi:ABC-2 type transport system permease protein